MEETAQNLFEIGQAYIYLTNIKKWKKSQTIPHIMKRVQNIVNMSKNLKFES